MKSGLREFYREATGERTTNICSSSRPTLWESQARKLVVTKLAATLSLQPFPMEFCRSDQLTTVDSAERLLELRQFREACLEQPHGSARPSALNEKVRSGNLDQTLDEPRLVTRGVEPHLLPGVVRFPELEPIESLGALAESIRAARDLSLAGLPRRSHS